MARAQMQQKGHATMRLQQTKLEQHLVDWEGVKGLGFQRTKR